MCQNVSSDCLSKCRIHAMFLHGFAPLHQPPTAPLNESTERRRSPHPHLPRPSLAHTPSLPSPHPPSVVPSYQPPSSGTQTFLKMSCTNPSCRGTCHGPCPGGKSEEGFKQLLLCARDPCRYALCSSITQRATTHTQHQKPRVLVPAAALIHSRANYDVRAKATCGRPAPHTPALIRPALKYWHPTDQKPVLC